MYESNYLNQTVRKAMKVNQKGIPTKISSASSNYISQPVFNLNEEVFKEMLENLVYDFFDDMDEEQVAKFYFQLVKFIIDNQYTIFNIPTGGDLTKVAAASRLKEYAATKNPTDKQRILKSVEEIYQSSQEYKK